MKQLLFLALLTLAFSACRPEQSTNQNTQTSDTALSVILDDQPEWQYENLRLYPVVASEDFIRQNNAASQLKTLGEAIKTYGFRISEKKPYGRFEDAGAVNNLTVQNKTSDPIFLLGGDIVQGGRQDRVVGDDQIIAARSLQDIPVFCVEHGRWTYHDATDEEAADKAANDKIFAFSGYYHVASGDIRRTLNGSKSQEEVWNQVSQITEHHAAVSNTGAYASLEESVNFTHQRDAYLHFFGDKFTSIKNMVGVIAASGNKVIGTDVFGHPELFQRQFTSLLHSYTTDAITLGSAINVNTALLERQIQKVNKAIDNPHLLHYQGALVHYYKESSGIE